MRIVVAIMVLLQLLTEGVVVLLLVQRLETRATVKLQWAIFQISAHNLWFRVRIQLSQLTELAVGYWQSFCDAYTLRTRVA